MFRIGAPGVAGTVTHRLRLGVIGLGRDWEVRHKPALARLRDRIEVTVLFDQVARRAELEADQLRCRAIHGLAALLANPEVDAVAWLAPQWFGMQPVLVARAVGKPILCVVPLPATVAELDRLDPLLIREPGPMRVFWPTGGDDAAPVDEVLIQFSEQIRVVAPTDFWSASLRSLRAAIEAQRAALAGSPS